MSSHALQPPVSPYQVMAGTVISAALITGINSDLPGQILATVTEPVYDTRLGKYLLIPQGTRLIGEYDSQVAFGQRRVLLVWNRLIFPDASSLTLDRLAGVDAAGNAGLEDGVDRHWRQLLAGAALSTLIGVAAELAAPDRSNGQGQVVVSHAAKRAGQHQSGRSGADAAQSQRAADTHHPRRLSAARHREQGHRAAAVSTAVHRPLDAMTAKLKLGRLPSTEVVKITIAMSVELKAMLDRYAAVARRGERRKERPRSTDSLHARSVHDQRSRIYTRQSSRPVSASCDGLAGTP